MFNQDNSYSNEQTPLSRILLKLSVEEKSLVREYAKAYFASSQEYVLPVVSVFEDPVFQV